MYPGEIHVRNSEIQKAKNRSLVSSVGIVTRLRTGLPKNRGSTPGKGSISYPKRPDRFWDASSLSFIGYQELLP